MDLKAPAEHVKAEVMARMLAWNGITQFLADTGVVSKPLPRFSNSFK
jgi:hypothetical protein